MVNPEEPQGGYIESLIERLRDYIDLLDTHLVDPIIARQGVARALMRIRGQTRDRKREEAILEKIVTQSQLGQDPDIVNHVDFLAIYRDHILPDWEELEKDDSKGS